MNNKRDRKQQNSNMRWINKREEGETMGKYELLEINKTETEIKWNNKLYEQFFAM